MLGFFDLSDFTCKSLWINFKYIPALTLSLTLCPFFIIAKLNTFTIMLNSKVLNTNSRWKVGVRRRVEETDPGSEVGPEDRDSGELLVPGQWRQQLRHRSRDGGGRRRLAEQPQLHSQVVKWFDFFFQVGSHCVDLVLAVVHNDVLLERYFLLYFQKCKLY